jgi:Concanavalin A-like lectin/glucanases superfamily
MKTLLVLLLSLMSSFGALNFHAYNNTQLTMPTHPSYGTMCTTNITISWWATKRENGNNQGAFLGPVQTQLLIKHSGDANDAVDWCLDTWRNDGGVSQWRTSTAHKATNYWIHYVLTYTFLDTNSMRLYTNGVSFPGVWINFPTNHLGSNIVGAALWGIAGSGGSAGRWQGKMSEIAIWSKILNKSQIDTLRTSRIKGYCRMVEPAFLQMYFPLDGTPCDINADGRFNAQPDRSFMKAIFASQPATGVTFPIGTGEQIHSYYPNQ